MPYRQTANVLRRLAEREDSILVAARDAAAEGGIRAVQIVPVAQRAGIAAGTVYRYFPAKADLVAQLVATVSAREIAAMRDAAIVAPGPLSALAAVIVTFATRASAQRRLAYALLAEPADSDFDEPRSAYRQALVAELSDRIAAAMGENVLPEQDVTRAAPAVVGALIDGLLGPAARDVADDQAQGREAVQEMALFALRALGVVDAHARGLVAHAAMPAVSS
ncbi:MAG TPA: TetR/AcrR family transcriptional regulator [Pseudolabrys sp.]